MCHILVLNLPRTQLVHFFSLSLSLAAAARQRRLLRQLLDHQDVLVEEKRQWRLRVQRMRPLPEAALGTSVSHYVVCFILKGSEREKKNTFLLVKTRWR